jgi:hypothetical protein
MKEPKCACLGEAKASHWHKIWTEVFSSVTHFLQVGLLLSPMTYKCHLMVLCPVRRLITTLGCVLLKDNNRTLAASLRPEINSWVTAVTFYPASLEQCRSQWPRGLRSRCTAARLLRSWVRIPPGVWMFVCSVCCVLSGRGLWDELITCPEESYRLWRVVVCDQETSWTRRP